MIFGRAAPCVRIGCKLADRPGCSGIGRGAESTTKPAIAQTPAARPVQSARFEKFSAEGRQTVCSIVLVVVQDMMTTGDDGTLNGTNGSGMTVTEDDGGRVAARRP